MVHVFTHREEEGGDQAHVHRQPFFRRQFLLRHYAEVNAHTHARMLSRLLLLLCVSYRR